MSDAELDELSLLATKSLSPRQGRVVLHNGTSAELSNTITAAIGSVAPHHAVVQRVAQRLSNLTMIPLSHTEPFLAFQYVAGRRRHGNDSLDESFRAHLDVHARPDMATSSRVMSCAIYLQVPDAGGETVFPLGVPVGRGEPHKIPAACEAVVAKDPARQPAAERDAYLDGSESPHAPSRDGRGLVVRPERGAMLCWFNLRADMSLDPASRHAGCPVTSGTKLIITRWLHTRPVFDERRRLAGSTAQLAVEGVPLTFVNDLQDDVPIDVVLVQRGHAAAEHFVAHLARGASHALVAARHDAYVVRRNLTHYSNALLPAESPPTILASKLFQL